jgi:hypothetical protein
MVPFKTHLIDLSDLLPCGCEVGAELGNNSIGFVSIALGPFEFSPCGVALAFEGQPLNLASEGCGGGTFFVPPLLPVVCSGTVVFDGF